MGRDVKVGYARVRINGIWKRWEEIEKREIDKETEKASEREENTNRRGNERDFA